MKKTALIIATLVLIVCFTGCGAAEKNTAKTTDTKESTKSTSAAVNVTETTTISVIPKETTETHTKPVADKLYRPEKKYFCSQYSAYVFCTDTEVQDYVKMRFGPSKYDYDVVTIIYNYSGVVVESEDVNGWTLCQYLNYEGWVRSDFIFKRDEYIPCDGMDGIGDKPVLYLYPEKKTDVTVKVNLHNADFSCTYPTYKNGWNVIALPDGTLINKDDGLEYSYLYWELQGEANYDFSKGFVVKGKDTMKFLQTMLPKIGLLPKEYNEFIVYWLPKMQNNRYNLISFQEEAYTDNVHLDITPEPDSVLRVFMAYKALDEYIEIEPQCFDTFNRNGFTVIEWGGAEVK